MDPSVFVNNVQLFQGKYYSFFSPIFGSYPFPSPFKPAKHNYFSNTFSCSHHVSKVYEFCLYHLKYPDMEGRQPVCAGCGGKHPRAACRYKETICQRCDHKGHLSRVCCTSQPTIFHTRQPPMPPPQLRDGNRHPGNPGAERIHQQRKRMLIRPTSANKLHKGEENTRCHPNRWFAMRHGN